METPKQGDRNERVLSQIGEGAALHSFEATRPGNVQPKHGPVNALTANDLCVFAYTPCSLCACEKQSQPAFSPHSMETCKKAFLPPYQPSSRQRPKKPLAFFRLPKSGACATPPHYRSGGGTEWAFPDL